jgi:hypothetical protein
MENGQDLVTMCCHAYESPDGADEEEEEEELVDYCKLGLSCKGISLRRVCECTASSAEH